MKYFLSSNSGEDLGTSFETATEQKHAYALYLDSIREKLPPSLLYIIEKVYFADHQVQQIGVDTSASSVRITVTGETSMHRMDQTYILCFSGVSYFNISNPLQGDTAQVRTFLEVTQHEIEAVEPDSFEYRLAFVGKTELAIRFNKFHYEIISRDGDGKNEGVSLEIEELLVQVENAARVGSVPKPHVLRELAQKSSTGNSYTHYRLGEMAMTAGDYDLAAEQLILAVEMAPDHTPTRFALAKAKYLLHEYQHALYLIENILAENPSHPGALLYYVRISAATEQWDVLEQFCTKEVLSVSGEVRLWQVLSLVKTGQASKAETIYQSISKSIQNKNAQLNKRILSEMNR